jgi:hypothetical protein
MSFYLEIGRQIFKDHRANTPMPGFFVRPHAPCPSLWSRFISLFTRKKAIPAVIHVPSEGVYTAFSGVDLTVSIDGVLVGEMQEIYYKTITPIMVSVIGQSTYPDRHLIQDYPVVVACTYALFSDESVPGYDGMDEMEIVLDYKNEYGAHSRQVITGARVISIEGGTSVDEMVSERRVIMIARDVSPLQRIA